MGLHGRWIALVLAAWLQREPDGDVSMFSSETRALVDEWRGWIAADGLRAALRSAAV